MIHRSVAFVAMSTTADTHLRRAWLNAEKANAAMVH